MRKAVVLTFMFFGSLPSFANAQGRGSWVGHQCDLNTGHFLVNSGVLYLSAATETNFEDQRESQLGEAKRVLDQAIRRGQADNPAVWYYYGRYYQMKSDPLGADSSWRKTVAIQPDCAEDIDERRRQMWVPLVNAGITAFQANEADSAVAVLTLANAIWDREPQGFYYLADLKGRQFQQPDSAIHYFRIAISLTDTSEASQSIRTNSTYMIARFYHIAGELDSALTWYRQYRELDPSDADVISSLVEIHTTLGDEATAMALIDTIVSNADQFSSEQVLDAGVTLFLAERYDAAAMAFERGLEGNPYSRDGLYNLANTYVAISQELGDELQGEELAQRKAELGGMLRPITDRLLEVDGHNQQSLRLFAQAFQLLGEPDSTLAVLELARAMEFDVTVEMFQSLGGDQYSLSGTIINLTESVVSVPAIDFEFIDTEGNVIVTERVSAANVDAMDSSSFDMAPVGNAIAGWRYRVASE